MKTLPFKIWQQNAFRALLIGVFFGLLFSCGEGIRLFPFSELENKRKGSDLFHQASKVRYQLSLHRFENTSVNLFNKQQSKQFQPLLDCFKEIWQIPRVVKELITKKTLINFSPFKQQVYSGAIANRAPPF